MRVSQYQNAIDKFMSDKSKPAILANIDRFYSVCYYANEDCTNDPENTEEDRKLIWKWSAMAKAWCLEMLTNGTGQGEQVYDLYNRFLLLEAPYLFDSYMLYIEKDREPQERFYQPKRRQLLKLGIIQLMQDLEDDKLDMASISMPPGTGKAQPLYSKILTPRGFVRMGDIKVGDTVMSATGNESKVLGVFPQGERDIYELTFDDGSKCRCSDNHLWTVQTRDDRRRGQKYRTVPLTDMLKNYKVENGKRLNYSIDYVGRIDFPEKDFILHPYVMGVLLGDGCFVNRMVTLPDESVRERFEELLPDGYRLEHKDRYDYRYMGHEGNNRKAGSLITKTLNEYGLQECHSYDKFIPEDYLTASYEQRLWLLRGLMDTDGTASKNIASYSTTSPMLRDGVIELVHSLGGYASVSSKIGSYRKEGQLIECRECYNITVQFSSEMEDIFTLERKHYAPKRSVIKRFISNIEYVGREECQCIYIDDPSHLYVTDNYIITHNTTLEKFFATWVFGRHVEAGNLFYSHSGDITRMFYDGVMDICTNAEEYNFHAVFPKCKLQSTNAKRETINFGKAKAFANLQTTSVGAKNAGKVRIEEGGYLFCDDMIGGIEEAMSATQLDKIWSYYTVDARQRRKPNSKELIIATRWSVNDPIGRLQREYEGSDRVRFLSVPDIDPETGKSNFEYQYNGFPVEFFEDIAKLMDDVSYRCLYKNEPIEREGLLYHDEDFEHYLSLPTEEPDAILGVCDTKDRGSDYCAMPIFYQYGDRYFLVDVVFDNNSDMEIVDTEIADTIARHNCHQVQFESNSAGGRVADEIKKRLAEKKCRASITKKFTTANKETKIIVNSAWVKSHVVLKDRTLYTQKSQYAAYVAAVMSYSVAGKNKHDDAPDSLAMFAEFSQKMMKPTMIVANPFG